MSNKFSFTPAKPGSVSDEDLLNDLKRVSSEKSLVKITQKVYSEFGNFNTSTIIRRFNTWNEAIKKAGLQTSNTLNVSDEELFKNILTLWEHLGRQPRRSDLTNIVSKYSQSPYNRRFSTWTNALEKYVIWANGEDINAPEEKEILPQKRNTGRDPSLRLRFKVLQRDNFSCKQCGASPAKDQSIELHIDHIIPWSKGGDTVFENLQTLCLKCNLGKSNL
jgi:5-methylcytosine-specific restriction endonuclease McrA